MGGHRFRPEKADKLMSAERKKSLPPEKVLTALELGGNDTVADLGAGNGYFTIPMAKRTKKRVYAVDIEPKMLAMLKSNAEKEQLHNIQYVQSDLEHIQLDESSVSKILLAFVMHEVGNMEQALREVKRILQPGGLVFFLEWEAIETDEGPPLHERIPSREMVDFLENNGFDTEMLPIDSRYYGIKAVVI